MTSRHGRNASYGIALILMSLPWLALAGWEPLLLAPLVWGTASFSVVGLGYLGLGPRVLGKRDDGTLSPARVALLLPFFFASAILYQLHRLVRGRPVDHVGDGIYVAGRLAPREVPESAKVVVDLTAELAEPRAIRERVRYLLLPTLDGCAPELSPRARELVDTLVAMHDEHIVVHCAFGHGRSAAVAAAVLIERGHAEDVDAAEAMMRRGRPQIRMTAAQRKWVREITRMA
jgi:protein-tyrosine phosphatase